MQKAHNQIFKIKLKKNIFWNLKKIQKFSFLLVHLKCFLRSRDLVRKVWAVAEWVILFVYSLRHLGYNVSQYSNPDEIFHDDVLENTNLVIIDMDLPQLNGFNFYKELNLGELSNLYICLHNWQSWKHTVYPMIRCLGVLQSCTIYKSIWL